MANVRAKKSVKGKVFDRAKQGICLIDGCGCKSWQRGLCCKHYQLFYRAKMAMPKKDRIIFEQATIEAGLILAAHQISEIRRPNPFNESESA